MPPDILEGNMAKIKINLTRNFKRNMIFVMVALLALMAFTMGTHAVDVISANYQARAFEASIQPPADGRTFESRSQTVDGRRQLPIYSVDRDDMRIAISFDAAWGADDTDTLLAILREHNVLTTFFLCGYWVDKYPEEVRRIHAAGHDIANHGDTHAHGAKLNLEANKREIMGVHNKVRELLGIEMNLFRPPFGEYNNTVLQAADALGYFTIQWDIDSHDWMDRGVQYEVDRVLNHPKLQSGSIILFHNDAPNTPQTLPTILRGLQERGFTIVPISQLIHQENFHMNHEGRQVLKQQ